MAGIFASCCFFLTQLLHHSSLTTSHSLWNTRDPFPRAAVGLQPFYWRPHADSSAFGMIINHLAASYLNYWVLSMCLSLPGCCSLLVSSAPLRGVQALSSHAGNWSSACKEELWQFSWTLKVCCCCCCFVLFWYCFPSFNELFWSK